MKGDMDRPMKTERTCLRQAGSHLGRGGVFSPDHLLVGVLQSSRRRGSGSSSATGSMASAAPANSIGFLSLGASTLVPFTNSLLSEECLAPLPLPLTWPGTSS